MKTFSIFVLVLSAWASSASAQVIYQPVRYQYGPNVYYGGTNPAFRNSVYPNLPPGLQSCLWSPARRGAAGSEFILRLWVTFRGLPALSTGTPQPTVHVYSDALPYQDASQYGYTPDDVRNEAYANVPRVQYGGGPIIQEQPAAGPRWRPRNLKRPLRRWIPGKRRFRFWTGPRWSARGIRSCTRQSWTNAKVRPGGDGQDGRGLRDGEMIYAPSAGVRANS